MKKYEILEHTTDLKIRAFGKTKEELFLNMLNGMFFGAGAKTENQEFTPRKIKIKSADEQSLLVDFLSEVLAQSDINNEAYLEVKFEKLAKTELEAKIFGVPVKSFGIEIKAVTYHGLEIKKNSGGWEATVLFDI
ncbi:MAG: archease [Patescibacteria group bacterium]